MCRVTICLHRGLVAGLVTSALGCTPLPDGPPARPTSSRPTAAAREARPQPAAGAADLRVRAELKGAKVVQAGTTPWATAALVNTSRTTPRPVVRPGDGSESGRREPHVYWTATLDPSDGRPVAVPSELRPICGLFDGDWVQNAVLLRPGDSVPLDAPVRQVFQRPGRGTLTAHYDYRAGDPTRVRAGIPPGGLGLMAGVPAFTLASDPIEFEVVRPLDLRVRVTGRLKAGVAARLSDVLEVTLVNQSTEPAAYTPPTVGGDTQVGVAVDGPDDGPPLRISEHGAGGGRPRTLRPGEAVRFVGPGESSLGFDGRWERSRAGAVRVAAVYRTATADALIRLESEWAEVVVEE